MIERIKQSHQRETLLEAEAEAMEAMDAAEAVAMDVEMVDTAPLNGRSNSLNKL